MNNQASVRRSEARQEQCACTQCNACRRYPLRALAFLVLLITLTVGVILGAVFYESILPVLATVIAFAVTLAVIVIAILIYWRRRCE